MSDPASSFELPRDDGSSFSLKDAKGKYLVLYFYPKDDTPGCTREAQAFDAAQASFAKRGALVVGVSRDSIERHKKFKDKYGLGLPLLSDADSEVHKAYGAFGEKKLYGKVSVGALRSTVLIDPAGKILTRWSNVKVDGHADAVLAALDSHLAGGPAEAPAPAKAAKKAVAKKSVAEKTVKKG